VSTEIAHTCTHSPLVEIAETRSNNFSANNKWIQSHLIICCHCCIMIKHIETTTVQITVAHRYMLSTLANVNTFCANYLQSAPRYMLWRLYNDKTHSNNFSANIKWIIQLCVFISCSVVFEYCDIVSTKYDVYQMLWFEDFLNTLTSFCFEGLLLKLLFTVYHVTLHPTLLTILC
jgi:hypothetical protein